MRAWPAASRRTPDTQVALIEAGPRDNHPFIHIPATVGAAIGTPAINWRFMTVPQEHLAGRAIPIPRGHVLGGSGSINGMVYFRGHPSDFDDWAAAGNPGWSYREVLPYFLRSEHNEAYPDSPYHGHEGPMNVKFIARPNPMTPAFLEAMQGLGFKRTADFNGPTTEGYGPRQGTILNGRRVSTATAYLRPASAPPQSHGPDRHPRRADHHREPPRRGGQRSERCRRCGSWPHAAK